MTRAFCSSSFRRITAAGLVSILCLAAGSVSIASTYDPSSDVNSMYSTTQYTGAAAWWNAGYTGRGVDVALIDWVVQHAHDPGLNIRVINLSYGTNSTQVYTLDPLAYAVEQAWKHGIVVVAAGGNSGFQRHMNNAPALSDPAFDPFLLAVGASD